MELVIQNYLPMKNIDLWKEDPEQFIEHEDEHYFISDYDIDSECNLSFLSYQLLDKLLYNFYRTCYPHITE